MAKILSIEVEASQVRVAEIEVRGKKGRIFNCFCIPAPQGAVEVSRCLTMCSRRAIIHAVFSSTVVQVFSSWQQRS